MCSKYEYTECCKCLILRRNVTHYPVSVYDYTSKIIRKPIKNNCNCDFLRILDNKEVLILELLYEK